MIYRNLRRPEIWVLCATGVIWMEAALDQQVLIAVLGVLPGALMLTAGVGSLFLPGDRGLTRAAGLGGLIGLLLAVPVLLFAFADALWLGGAAAAAIVCAGLLSAADARLPDGLIAPAPSPRLGAEVGIDEAVLGITNVAMPPFGAGDAARIVRETIAAGELFESRGWLSDPLAYHVTPPGLEAAEIRSQPRRCRGWDYEAVSFDSGFEPAQDSPGRDRYLGFEACREAHANVLRSSPEAPWLICIHGLGMGYPWIDFGLFPIKLLHRELGLNLVFPTLPLHGPRSRYAVSGRGFLSGDVMDTVHALSQAVWDIRRVLDWTRRQTDAAPAVLGASLGGYTAAIISSIEDELASTVLAIPATDLTSLLWWHASSGVRQDIEQAGLTQEAMGRAMTVVSPLSMTPTVDPSRRYFFAGLLDSFVPAAEVVKLWEHWGRCRIQWYPGAHLSFGFHPQVDAFVADALRESLPGAERPDAAV